MSKSHPVLLTLSILIPAGSGSRLFEGSGAEDVVSMRAETTADVDADTAVRTVPVAAVAEPASVRAAPDITIVGADAADLMALVEALARFDDNELMLPDLEVRFFDDEADCNGHHGLFQNGVTPWRALICSDLDFVITHELAHAWTAANLDDGSRDRYLRARGLTAWHDHDLPWEERGGEDAAFVIQQNLMMEDAPLSSPTWQERIAAYELLTGSPSPRLTSA